MKKINQSLNNDTLLLIKKHRDTFIEQRVTQIPETLEKKLTKRNDFFSFSRPKNFYEEGKWFLAVAIFETTNSVFNVTCENNSFSV